MPITEDASAPAEVTDVSNIKSTASFTPAANSLIVAIANAGNNTGAGTVTCPVTDSLGSTWTLLKRTNTDLVNGAGSTEVWAMDAGASPAARTVTVTGTGGANAVGVSLCVKVLTGAKPVASVLGASANPNGGNNYTIALTTTATGSLVVGGLSRITSNVTLTVNGSTTAWQSVSDGTNTETYGAWRALNLTGTPGADTYGYTNTAAAAQVLVAVELLAAADGDTSPSPRWTPGFMTQGYPGFPAFLQSQANPSWPLYDTGVVVGPQAYQQLLNAALNFTSSQQLRISKTLAATLSFTGLQIRRTNKTIAATVSFTSSLTTAVVHFFTQALAATVGFTSSQIRTMGKTLAGSLSFTGNQVRTTGHAIAASVSFTGSQTRRTTKIIGAAVSFAGAQVRRTAKTITATVSFTGSLISRQVINKLFTATVGFTGGLTTAAVHHFTQALNATVGFTSAQTRHTGHAVSASLAFASSQSRQIGPNLAATLGFTGGITRRILHRLTSAVGFIGNLLGGAGGLESGISSPGAMTVPTAVGANIAVATATAGTVTAPEAFIGQGTAPNALSGSMTVPISTGA